MRQFFPMQHECSVGNGKAELDLFHYMTKANLKGAAGLDISNLAAKSYVVSLKLEEDKIDIDKLKAVPADLTKLNNIVDNNVVT